MSATDTVLGEAGNGGHTIRRLYTTVGVDPFDTVEWEIRNARIGHGDKVPFEQKDVEFPKSWTQNATNIVAQKYFRGQLDSEARERSVKQMIGRVSKTISDWGRERSYFATTADGDNFEAELTYILLHQMAAFNSPVWFNVGFEENPQCSACFILSVEDTMDSILDWNTKEGRIFRGGSGAGINLSNIRGSMETLSKGGTASGPVSFMRGTDSWAGTIKSGGKTRRAAKMVILDIDHPDVREFIWCKVKEEDKAAALRDAGFDMSIDGSGFTSIQYQNANNSIRVTDEFMRAVENDDLWYFKARKTGETVGEPIPARQLLQEMAEAGWRCADPGIQYDSEINAWHTCPNSGRINASNPCSEYMHVDDSACNLASLNLMKFRRPDGTFDTQAFEHAVDVIILAQDITVGTHDQPASSFPTEEIAHNARDFRQLGMGYANLGAYLMSNGMAYDSDEGRATAAAITALMNGRAYWHSAVSAAALAPYARYAENREAHNAVMRMHRDAAERIKDEQVTDTALLRRAREVNDEMVELGELNGYRNAQATVLAPTGTISFLMDCDTTGVEPDFSLVKFKELVGGGQMTIVNRTIPMALDTLGYTADQVGVIEAYISEVVDGRVRGTIIGAPGLKDEHLPVFDVAVGERAISWRGHVDMMGAVQPFISGAISKTVNMPFGATVEEITDAYKHAWKIGVKALAIYRDGSKTAQALRTDAQQGEGQALAAFKLIEESLSRSEWVKVWVEAFYEHFNPDWEDVYEEGKRKLPKTRPSITHAVSISNEGVQQKFYFTIGLFPDGTPAEIFAVASKSGSWMRGNMDQMCKAMSDGFQRGMTVEQFVAFYRFEKFEPHGPTNNTDITRAMSPVDYLASFVGTVWMDDDDLEVYSIDTRAIRRKKAEIMAGGSIAKPDDTVDTMSTVIAETIEVKAGIHTQAGPACSNCGNLMQRTGSCYTCSSCGNNTGCG